MDTPNAVSVPAVAGYRQPDWFDLLTVTFARSIDQIGEARQPARIRIRAALRWLGAGMMRTLSSPRVRGAGSWPRYTRDGLLLVSDVFAIIEEERSHASRDASSHAISRPQFRVGQRSSRLARKADPRLPDPPPTGLDHRRRPCLGGVRYGRRGLPVLALLDQGNQPVRERGPHPALPTTDDPWATRATVVSTAADRSNPPALRNDRLGTTRAVMQALIDNSHVILADRRQSLHRDRHYLAESAVSGPRQGWLPPDLCHLLGPADGTAARALWIGSGEGYPPLPAPRPDNPT